MVWSSQSPAWFPFSSVQLGSVRDSDPNPSRDGRVSSARGFGHVLDGDPVGRREAVDAAEQAAPQPQAGVAGATRRGQGGGGGGSTTTADYATAHLVDMTNTVLEASVTPNPWNPAKMRGQGLPRIPRRKFFRESSNYLRIAMVATTAGHIAWAVALGPWCRAPASSCCSCDQKPKGEAATAGAPRCHRRRDARTRDRRWTNPERKGVSGSAMWGRFGFGGPRLQRTFGFYVDTWLQIKWISAWRI